MDKFEFVVEKTKRVLSDQEMKISSQITSYFNDVKSNDAMFGATSKSLHTVQGVIRNLIDEIPQRNMYRQGDYWEVLVNDRYTELRLNKINADREVQFTMFTITLK